MFPAEATAETKNVYGEDFAEESVLMASSLPSLMDGHAEKEVTVKGEVAAVCKKKGCWMDIKLDNGEEMKVTFKDYGFFVPMDIESQTVVMHGVASYDTLDVEYLQHIAEDAGKSEEEIAQIMEPQVALVFEATGVKLEE